MNALCSILSMIIFSAQAPDPYAVADSLHSVQQASVTEVGAQPEADVPETESPVDGAVQATIDSLERQARTDSAVVAKKEAMIFKNQSIKNGSDFKRSVDPKLACLKFLLEKHARDTAQVVEYLGVLKQWLLTKKDFYYAARQTVPPKDRYLCVGYFKKMQAEGTKVQAFLDQLQATDDSLKVVVEKRLKM